MMKGLILAGGGRYAVASGLLGYSPKIYYLFTINP